ncbi:hypothetical protein FISHEDRAFT_54188 [Fistulina hepatica ATCC 64428]|uniref:Mediator of RNA polymerase II transcription subunit 4 n=1 Tax=Fistulina hepatica ATCC 64428 TaxID=1128425 RepID=A0A0D7A2B3_9AGAR|nr:hypothetical protein FISHEDRAFT_54188 [Fistulina hepatica ATCC 64428]
MSSMLLDPLLELESLAHSLFLSLSPPQRKPPPAPPLSAFLDIDRTLTEALDIAHKHQARQRTIEALQQEILELDSRWREICTQLMEDKQTLEEMVSEGDERVKATEDAKKAAIPYPELLTYAQALSAFTSAPPNISDTSAPAAGAPPPVFFPPFPNEEKMRRGRLNDEAPLGPAGQTHSVSRPVVPDQATVEADGPMPRGANPYRQGAWSQLLDFELDLDLNPDL